MKKVMFSLPVAAGLLLAAALNLFAQDQAETPQYHPGDLWVFKVAEKDIAAESTSALDGDYAVIYSPEGKFIVRRPGGGMPQGRQEFGILFALLSNPADETQFLQFPLTVGKKWKVSYQLQVRGGSSPVIRTADNNVTGMEEITTQAGKFRAFKIERYDTGGGGGRGAPPPIFSLTYYYSPETKSVVKYHFELKTPTGMTAGTRDIELIKFGSKFPK